MGTSEFDKKPGAYDTITLDGQSHQRVSGRRAYLQCLDYLLIQQESIRKLYDGLHDSLHNDPMGFVTNIIQPSLPKENNLTLDATSAPLQITFVPKEEPKS